MGVIFRREFKAFFRTLTGYIYLAVFTLAAAVLFLVFNLLQNSNSLVYIFADLLLGAVLLLPLIVMVPRRAAQKNGTGMLLDILPFTPRDTVLGGFFADFTLFCASSAVVVLFAFIVDMMGDFNYKMFFASYFMFLVFGAFLLAACRYLSAVFKNQIVAALAYVFIMALLFLGKPVSELFSGSPFFSLIFFAGTSLVVAIVFFIAVKKIIPSAVFFSILLIPCAVIYFAASPLFEDAAYKFVSAIAIFDIISYSSAGILDFGAALMFTNLTVFLIYLTVRSEDKKKACEVVINA